jgi:asparagine synthase (glutamine-hydrolysing)
MCGIAGIMRRDGHAPDAALLDGLEQALRHRGPDGEGRYFSGSLGLVQTRLAIIDLETGDQPLYEPDGAAMISNGEIYNYLELREELEGPDGIVAFSTHSDGEPALHLYRREGSDFAEHLRGMYAVAISDPDQAQLVLARDPFGIKPLYYAETADSFVFASEPQALIKSGLVSPQVLPRARNELLELQFSTGRKTLFEGIRRVLPGETLVVREGRVVERRRRAALPKGKPRDWSEAKALEQLETALMDSVEVHQRSDVPYGLFLSGGVDSSAILACMARLNDQPVRSFTAGFPGTGVHDERKHARKLARIVGAEHTEIEITETDFWSLLPEIASAVDDPAADYAILPTYKLAAAASKELKVVLCGEGGDEIFAGYGRYRGALRPWWMGGRALRSRGILDGFGVLREEPRGWRDGIVAAQSLGADDDRSRLQVAQSIDVADWLPNDLLIKLDRCLMAHGLEGRTPFLDPKVADVGFRLDDGLKIRDGRGKYLLRRWLEKALPEAQPFAKKRGFTVPVAEWIQGQGARLGPLVAAQVGVAEVCHPDRVRALYRKTGKRAGLATWNLLFYALWHQAHVVGRTSTGDVFDSLSDAGSV